MRHNKNNLLSLYIYAEVVAVRAPLAPSVAPCLRLRCTFPASVMTLCHMRFLLFLFFFSFFFFLGDKQQPSLGRDDGRCGAASVTSAKPETKVIILPSEAVRHNCRFHINPWNSAAFVWLPLTDTRMLSGHRHEMYWILLRNQYYSQIPFLIWPQLERKQTKSASQNRNRQLSGVSSKAQKGSAISRSG